MRTKTIQFCPTRNGEVKRAAKQRAKLEAKGWVLYSETSQSPNLLRVATTTWIMKKG